MERIFHRADILLPENCDMTRWSVVACDQFTSQPEYWAALEQLAEGVPSTLHLMLPEAYLERVDPLAAAHRINAEMRRYLDGGVFRTLKNSYIYIERTLHSGAVRRGLLGVLDLERYDYSARSASPVRATEGTVESRLPPRVEVRRDAALEMPHVMVFINDPEDRVIGALHEKRTALPKLYDFALSADGGHIRGWQIADAAADAVDACLDALTADAYAGDDTPVIFAMGDGNHSLATAKKCWEELKPGLSEEERKSHPARYSLVELVNIHDPAITFEPIHRVIFGTDDASFSEEAEAYFKSVSLPADRGHQLRLVTAGGERSVLVTGRTIGEVIAAAEDFCRSYTGTHGGKVDYIHNDDTALGMGRTPGNAALLLPRMEKSELFSSVRASGPFPKKSFSIGHAEDKRYYLECRKIKE